MAWLHKLTEENVNSLYYGEDYEEPFTGYYQSENMTAILLVYVTPEGKAFIWSSLGKDSNALKYMNNLIPEVLV